jgi:elongation factor G
VEVVTPEEALGEVIADLNARRGRIESIQQDGLMYSVRALVPLAEMFNYVTQLRSLTQGRGAYTMIFSHYEPVGASRAAASEKVAVA